MIRFVVCVSATFLAGVAYAQDARVTIGGVDQRVPSIEFSTMGQLLGDMGKNASHAAALYQIEKTDHEADVKRLSEQLQWWQKPENRAWVDNPQ